MGYAEFRSNDSIKMGRRKLGHIYAQPFQERLGRVSFAHCFRKLC